tara:strand:+ start:184 stop:435 length:252 start_codon:yes stop_codon:yes gene_type:complete
MASLPTLNSLRTFEAAARRLNFNYAAEVLNVTPSAVSHQIKELKKHLGMALFDRLHRGLALALAGETLLPGGASRIRIPFPGC